MRLARSLKTLLFVVFQFCVLLFQWARSSRSGCQAIWSLSQLRHFRETRLQPSS